MISIGNLRLLKHASTVGRCKSHGTYKFYFLSHFTTILIAIVNKLPAITVIKIQKKIGKWTVSSLSFSKPIDLTKFFKSFLLIRFPS